MTKPLSAEESELRGLDRRTVLRGVAVSGALGVSAPLLAACGGDSGGGSASSGGSGKAESSPSDGGGGSGGGAGSGGGGGGALGAASAVPVGGGTVFKKQKIVVTQPSNGDFKAFTAVCTHQGCIVNEVADGTINCPCHGSKYSIDDGSVVGGPAPAPLAEESISVAGGKISLG